MGRRCPTLPPGTSPASRARELERELRLLGPINPLALEEFTALQERHRFLEAQLDDVRTGRRELTKVIRAIDDEIVDVFRAAYADVAENFERLFATLFPGGQGRLRLTEPDHLLETGIEIEARPSGKNVRRLSLLSGGERTLTALAFLFAVFRSRPSPFYLMDEVEAALDDVNLHRFLDLVHEFRDEAQLLVVSHQKRTMEAADCLYGVTMQPGWLVPGPQRAGGRRAGDPGLLGPEGRHGRSPRLARAMAIVDHPDRRPRRAARVGDVRRRHPPERVAARSSSHRRGRPPPAVGTARKPDETLPPERLAEIEEALRGVEAPTAPPDEAPGATAPPPAGPRRPPGRGGPGGAGGAGQAPVPGPARQGPVALRRLPRIGPGPGQIDAETWDDLEEALIRADVGVETTTAVLDRLRGRGQADRHHRPRRAARLP